MNVSVRWLLDLVPGLELSASEIADHLALRGAPVEAAVSPGEGLADVVVGKVITAERHPNADRLTVCTVDGGSGVVPVVCGAPNVEAGGWYPFAPVGAVLPDGLKIKKAKIRGEVSQGMLCSSKELGLGTDHSGILALAEQGTPGQPVAAALGLDDTTLDVEVTANRGDLLSHVGVARELASEGSGEVVLPSLPGDPGLELDYIEGAPQVTSSGVTIRVEDEDLCGRYLGAVLRGLRVGPSPPWLQERLRGAGARPINNVVDATNYAMLELGHPLHAFDLGGLTDSTIVVRRAAEPEKAFTTLDDTERRLDGDMLMICDSASPVGLAGVMGGKNSEVEDDTTDVLLECAYFDPKSIRRTRKALGMSTDASYRFERGVDPEGMRLVIERCVALIVSTAGGRVDGPVLDCRPVRVEPRVVSLRLPRIEHLLGLPFAAASVRTLLTPLGFDIVAEEGDALQVRIPGFRSHDVRREVDLIEEVARAHGYDAFPATLGPYLPGAVPDDPAFRLEDELRRSLAAAGLFEAHTPAFAPEGEVEVANPLSRTERFMRSTLAPALLRRVEYNFSHGNRDVRLFEIGTAFRAAGAGEPPAESTHVAAVLTGRRQPPHWSADDEPLGVWDVKALLEDVVERCYRGHALLSPGTHDESLLDPASAFTVTDAAGAVLGGAGRVTHGRVDAPAWAGEVWALELKLPSRPRDPEPAAYERLPSFPPVERDLALLVPDGVTGERVTAVVRSAAGKLLEGTDLFDVYAGEGIAEGQRSLAFRLRFRSPERTLKDKEVDKAVRSVLRRLEEELGVEARG